MLEAPPDGNIEHFDKIRYVLDSIANALAKGRLATIDELVSAEVLGDLLEHAEELLKSHFNLAAAIILRAVLEERLRKMCASNAAGTMFRLCVDLATRSKLPTKLIDQPDAPGLNADIRSKLALRLKWLFDTGLRLASVFSIKLPSIH
jgi:hypothetical protein